MAMISIGESSVLAVLNSAPVALLHVNAAQRNARALRMNAPALVSNHSQFMISPIQYVALKKINRLT